MGEFLDQKKWLYLEKTAHMGVMDGGFTVPIKISLFVFTHETNENYWMNFIKFNVAKLDILNPSGNYM